MSIKITNQQLDVSMKAIEEINKLDMPAAITFKFGALMREAKNHYKTYAETMQKLVEKYTAKDAEGNPVPFVDPKTGEARPELVNITDPKGFTAERDALSEVQIEIVLEPVQLKEFGETKVQGWVFGVLDWYIKP